MKNKKSTARHDTRKACCMQTRWPRAFAFLFFFHCVDTVFAQVPPSVIKFPAGKNEIQVPFTRYRGWIIIQAQVNDEKTLSFILDTGAPIAVLADKAAGESLNLNIVGQAMVSGEDDLPPKPVSLAAGVKFRIGESEISNCMMAVGAAGEAISGIDGVIGKYLFENAVVAINWEKNILVITAPANYIYEGNGEIIPFRIMPSGHISGNVLIEKNGKKRMVNSIFDTGNRSTFKIKNLPQGEIYTDDEAIKNVITGWGANGEEKGDIAKVDLTIGSFRFSDVIAAVKTKNNRPEDSTITGNVGLSVLERFDIIFDYTRNRMILEKNESFDDKFIFTRSGIILHPKREQDFVIIAGILPRSSASENELVKEDTIIAINNKPVNRYSTDEIDSLINGKNISEIEIEIKRGIHLFRKKIKMKDMI